MPYRGSHDGGSVLSLLKIGRTLEGLYFILLAERPTSSGTIVSHAELFLQPLSPAAVPHC